MSIKIKVDPTATPEELDRKVPTISLEIRKTLDGKIMILDHIQLDIILDTVNNKIITFPKEYLSDEVYEIQSSYFKHLVNEGVIIPDSVISGNVYGSLEATYPTPADEGVSAPQVILLSTKKFIDATAAPLERLEYIEDKTEDHLVDPTPEDSTELGEVPEEPKKGSITPSRIRRYLSGYGYY